MGIKCPKCHSDNTDTARFCSNCATPLPSSKEIPVTKTLETPAEELTTGSTFAGRYQIIEELGKGGMGNVYRVLDKELKEEVALKLIKPEIASDEKTLERFNNELKLARKISHKNVGRMYELMEEEGTRYITMEYVPGEDLKRLIRKVGQFGARKAVSIAKQVCEGLVEAHRLGVVHRDLKPQNIMVDEEGNARILDFGIARSLKAKGITDAGVIIGTPEYMSPEQAEVKEVDQRSDIYSLGVILYEMTTGRVPFEGETALSIAMKHKSEAPKDPKEINSQIPDDLNRLILKCLEKDKEKRYQSAGEARSELDNIEKGIPTTDKEVPKKKPITSKEIKVTFGLKKLMIPALVVIAIVFIGLIIWSPWKNKESAQISSEKPSIAVLPFDDLSPKRDQESFCIGLAESLINALTQIQELRVPAITSSSLVKKEGNSIQEVGKRLSVKSVLRGSVQKAEKRVRITAQLISTDDEALIWSEQYNQDWEDIFAIQDDITQAIVDNLKLRLIDEETKELLKRPTDNIEAYNLYLLGRNFWNKRTREDLYKSIEYFEKALEKDPNYVLAYSGLADSYLILGNNGFISPGQAYPKAKEYALKAIEIDNRLANPHTALALMKIDYDWDWAGSEQEFRTALQLNPGYSFAHMGYAFLLSNLGRHEEAIKEVKVARDLDPLSPRYIANVGWLLYRARSYGQALEELENAIELYPEHGNNYFYAAEVYTALGRYEEALTACQRTEEITGEEPIILLAFVYAKRGNREEAVKFLKKIIEESKKDYISPTIIAPIYGFLGEYDQAFALLEKAYSEKDNYLTYLKVDPWYDPLRADPRFQTLLKRMNLD